MIRGKSRNLLFVFVTISIMVFIIYKTAYSGNRQEEKENVLLKNNDHLVEDLNASIVKLSNSQKVLTMEMQDIRRDLDSVKDRRENQAELSMDEEPPGIRENENAENSQEQQQVYYQKRAEYLEAKVENQDSSSQWAVDNENDIYKAVQAVGNQLASISNVKCGETLCVMDVAYVDIDSRNQFLEEITQQSPFRSQCFFPPPGDDETENIRSRMYVSREGYRLFEEKM